MQSGTRSLPPLRVLTDVIEALGPITRDNALWTGEQRGNHRTPIVLPMRLRLIDRQERPIGAAFTARSRDMCGTGVGLTIPCRLEATREYQVEVFTDIGTWMGRMRAAYCSPTEAGYVAGLQCPPLVIPFTQAVKNGSKHATAKPSAAGQTRAKMPQSAALTLNQAQEEIHQAVRKYRLSRYSWGLFGTSVAAEIGRILKALPMPENAVLRLDPRRRDYRHDVAGEVHVFMPSCAEQRMLKTQIADLSRRGARLAVFPEDLNATGPAELLTHDHWAAGTPLVIGMWAQDAGTLWLPGEVVHGNEGPAGLFCVGVQFTAG